MSQTTITIAILIGLLVRLAAMKEVRQVHKLLGRRTINTTPVPPSINNIYTKEGNTDVCNHFFYSRLGIQYSFAICVLATGLSLLLAATGLFGAMAGPELAASSSGREVVAGKLRDTTWPALVVSQDGEDGHAVALEGAGRLVVVIAHGTIESVYDNPTKESVLLFVGAGGAVSPLGGSARITHVLLFGGVLSALICSLLAGKVRAHEEVEKETKEAADASGGDTAHPPA